MSRRMSVSMTIDAVRNRTKTVTRRHVDTWKNLKAGDRLTLVEKGQGLRKGEHQVVLAEVEVVDVRVEPIGLAGSDEATLEGFPEMDGPMFVEFWLRGHGYLTHVFVAPDLPDRPNFGVMCRRIEWRYLDEATP